MCIECDRNKEDYKREQEIYHKTGRPMNLSTVMFTRPCIERWNDYITYDVSIWNKLIGNYRVIEEFTEKGRNKN